MRNRWSPNEAESIVASLEGVCNPDVARLVYASRLLGDETGLVLHGGGNSSIKTTVIDIFGDALPALFVKAQAGTWRI